MIPLILSANLALLIPIAIIWMEDVEFRELVLTIIHSASYEYQIICPRHGEILPAHQRVLA